MNSPGLVLTIGMVLARDAGVNDAEVSHAIELSARLLRFYAGKGAVPYGDHPAWIETHEDNGKCGMAAILFTLLGESANAEYFTRMAIASHGGERDCGHTGNYFNMLCRCQPSRSGDPMQTVHGPMSSRVVSRFGTQLEGSFTHQGPPEPEHDSYHGWDATGAYLLAYALPLKKTALTGRVASLTPNLSREQVQSLLEDGKGWDNKDRTSFYDALEDKELLKRLASWSPTVRQRAADAIKRRKEPPVSEIIAMLSSESVKRSRWRLHGLRGIKTQGISCGAKASGTSRRRRHVGSCTSRIRSGRHRETGFDCAA